MSKECFNNESKVTYTKCEITFDLLRKVNVISTYNREGSRVNITLRMTLKQQQKSTDSKEK